MTERPRTNTPAVEGAGIRPERVARLRESNPEAAVAKFSRFTRVSLRTALVLITLACLWAGKVSMDARRQQAAVAWVAKNGGTVIYDWQRDEKNPQIKIKENPTPQCLRGALADDYFQTVVGVSVSRRKISDLSPLADLPRLRILRANEVGIRNIEPLAALGELEMLILSDNEIVDLEPLAGLQKLETLQVDNNEIVDLSPLRGLGKLETLIIDGNKVSDVEPIGKLPSLKALEMSKTEVGDLTPLKTLPRLEMIRCRDCEIVDCSPLLELPTLRIADLYGNPGLSKEDDVKLQQHLGRPRP